MLMQEIRKYEAKSRGEKRRLWLAEGQKGRSNKCYTVCEHGEDGRLISESKKFDSIEKAVEYINRNFNQVRELDRIK